MAWTLGPGERGFDWSFNMKQLFSALKPPGGLNYILIGIFQTDEIKYNPKSPLCTRKGHLLTWRMSHFASWHSGVSSWCLTHWFFCFVLFYFLFWRSEWGNALECVTHPQWHTVYPSGELSSSSSPLFWSSVLVLSVFVKWFRNAWTHLPAHWEQPALSC